MRKTAALFAFALLLLSTAFLLFLKGSSKNPETSPTRDSVASRPLTSEPKLDPPKTHPSPAQVNAASSLEMGDVVRLSAKLGASHLYAQESARVALLIDLAARAADTHEGRAPMAVALVLDRSGSMAGEKIARARQAAKDLVHRLDDNDQLALVTYASDYSEDIPLTRVKGQRERIQRAIDAILDGGGTNLSGGLDTGLRALRAVSDGATLKRLILLSDGNANQGVTDPETLATTSRVARSQGITISTLGVGVDFNEDLMTLIAQSGGGGYYYAKNALAIATAFEREIQGLVQVAARNVEVALEIPAGVSIKEVYGYRTELRGGRTVLSVGDMASEAQRRIVLELEAKAVDEGPVLVTGIVLSHGLPHSAQTREHHGVLSAMGTNDLATARASSNREVTEAIEAAVLAKAREEAAATYQIGRRSEARALLESQIQSTRQKNAVLQSPALEAEVGDMERVLKNILSIDSASEEGRDLIKREKLRARELMTY